MVSQDDSSAVHSDSAAAARTSASGARGAGAGMVESKQVAYEYLSVSEDL